MNGEPVAGPPRHVSHYTLTYQILADSRHEAILRAGMKLRKAVHVVSMVSAEQGLPGWWDVVLAVEEDLDPPEPAWDLPESADPLTAAKAEAAR